MNMATSKQAVSKMSKPSIPRDEFERWKRFCEKYGLIPHLHFRAAIHAYMRLDCDFRDDALESYHDDRDYREFVRKEWGEDSDEYKAVAVGLPREHDSTSDVWAIKTMLPRLSPSALSRVAGLVLTEAEAEDDREQEAAA